VPTLFSMTAMGAFSVAYNLVAARQKDPHSPENPVGHRPPRANPWVAGIAALLLVTVLGNLDTARVFFTEVAKVGGYEGPGAYSLTTQRRNSLMNDFQEINEREPNPEELAAIEHEAQNPPIGAGTVNTIEQWLDLSTGFARGFGDVMGGAPLQMHTHRWYWAPTRVIAELPEGRGHNAINEMPWFTFLYGDLHAHMMSMPIMLTILLWLAAEILGAGKRRRGWVAAGMSLFVGGLSVGLIRATNSWDWPTFLILGIAGLTFAAWITQSRYAEERPEADSVVAKKLMRFLDLRHSLRLWWLVWLIPLGMWLHASWWVVSLFRYDAKLDAGQIPVQCQDLPAGLRIPAECRGLTEPVWRLADSLTWAFALPMLGVLVYVTLLVMARAHMNRNSLTNWLGRVAVFVGVSLVTVLPFTANYAAHAAIIPWESDRTPLWAYLDIHGLFLFIFASFVIWQTIRLLRRFTVGHLVGLGLPALLVMVGAPLTLFIALIVGLTSVPVMLVTLPLIAWATGLFLIPGTSHVERVIYALMVLGLGLTTGVELIVLDIDIGRQNTVFKFYLEAWILFGISGGVALAWLLNALGRWIIPLRIVWQTMLAALVTIAFLYPIMATQARWIDRFNASATGMTLDGQAYMQHAVYGDNNVWFNTVGDYHMINWLLENIDGTPTIIEAQTTEYKWGARIAINTGLPTVMGWNWHQRQQRNVLDLNNVVWNRTNNVAAFYNTPSMETAWDLIQFYDIEYIIVGVLERVTYNDLEQNGLTMEVESGLSPGISKFDRMVDQGLLEVVYEADSCVMNVAIEAEDCPPENIVTDRIYHVVSDAVYDVAARD
jgi:uncharacterized membrane protein